MAKGQKADAPENQEERAAEQQQANPLNDAPHDQPQGAKEAGVENIPGPHRDRTRMVSRTDSGAILNAQAQPDQDLRVAVERGESNAPHDSRDDPTGTDEARAKGYVGFAPGGPGENDAPWAKSGGNR